MAFPFNGVIENSVQTLNTFADDGEYYYALRTRVENTQYDPQTDYYFERYDLSHKLIKSTKLSLLAPNRKMGKYEAIYSVGEKYVLFFSYFDTKQDVNVLYATNITKEGAQGPAFIVDKEMIQNYELGKYSFVKSPDSLSLLITRLDGYNKKLNRKIKFIVLNDNLENKWEKEVTLASTDKYLGIKDCLIDENGGVFLLYSYENKDKREPLYNIIAYSSSNNVIEDINIGHSKTMDFDNMNIIFNNDKVSLVGFYYVERNVLFGIYSAKIDKKTFAIENQYIGTFHPDTIAKYFSKSAQTRPLGVKPKYALTDIIVKKDGSLQLITENRALQGMASAIGGHDGIQEQKIHNNFCAFIELMIIKLDTSGKIVWTLDIPKYQNGYDDNAAYGAYLMTHDEENIYLLYNDNPKNIFLNSKKGWRNDKGVMEELNLKKVHEGGLMKVKVFPNGKATRELYKDDSGKNNIVIRTSNARKMKDGRIWLVGEDKVMYKYGFLKLN